MFRPYLFICRFAFWRRSEILIKIALDLAVVQLADLIRLFTEVLFKAFEGRDDVYAPIVKLAAYRAEICVKRFDLVAFHKSFAVRRICENYAARARGGQASHVCGLKMNIVFHARAFRML